MKNEYGPDGEARLFAVFPHGLGVLHHRIFQRAEAIYGTAHHIAINQEALGIAVASNARWSAGAYQVAWLQGLVAGDVGD